MKNSETEKMNKVYTCIPAWPHDPKPVQIEMVKCDCGCVVPRSQVMGASMGTACPDCYDDMSD